LEPRRKFPGFGRTTYLFDAGTAKPLPACGTFFAASTLNIGKMRISFALLLTIFTVGHTNMTFAEDGSGFGFREIYLSDGIVTSNQLIGLLGGFNGPASTYVSFPSFFTGGQYVSVKIYKKRRISLRVTAGFETAIGDLSYGDENHGIFGGYDGISGRYTRSVYTLGAEVVFKYVSTPRFTCYGLGGVGASLEQMTYQFNSGIPDQGYFFGTATSLVPARHYTESHFYPNAQISPIGLRFGGPLALFVEMGFGYRGLVSGGVCYRF
jgi:hypothetical protein